jgi:hypothetical protein
MRLLPAQVAMSPCGNIPSIALIIPVHARCKMPGPGKLFGPPRPTAFKIEPNANDTE